MRQGDRMSLFSLKDRVALVTGAGRGIGQAIAKGLASHGARVICAARTRSQLDETAEAIKAAGADATAVEMDVSSLNSIRDGVARSIEANGRIDILVNNAGVNIREPVQEVSEAHFGSIMQVNLKGLYFLTQAVIEGMVPREHGKIINIGSLTITHGLTQMSVYAASKGAVAQFTKVLALEVARHNIQVNALSPGFVLTPLTEKVWADKAFRQWAEERVPAGRLARPEDMVGTAIYLASSASDYLTGQCIYVDGGFVAGERWPLPGQG
jgi:NAD(P)-dependent dehydrogenase (short-subunit alcohol dehydrogenase family)